MTNAIPRCATLRTVKTGDEVSVKMDEFCFIASVRTIIVIRLYKMKQKDGYFKACSMCVIMLMSPRDFCNIVKMFYGNGLHNFDKIKIKQKCVSF